MPWPIPTFKKIERPKPISLGLWLSALTAIAIGMAGGVLLLWPHGGPTQGLQFWALLVGIPLVTCVLAYGIRLDRWEREQTIAEEAEREQERITLLWRGWCRRRVHVITALAVLPIPTLTAQLSDADADLPVNTGRAKAFSWTKGKTEAPRRQELLDRIARGLQATLADRQAMSIKLLLDDASLAFANAWKEATRTTFGKIAPNCNFTVVVERAVGCAQWLAKQVDLNDAAPHLIIAVQIWPNGQKEHNFSESAAALLIDQAATQAGYIFRPMIVASDTLEGDLAQVVDMQLQPDTATHVWFTRCDDESVAITSALTPDPKIPVIERQLDSVVGKPGPASSWIALATALEATQGTGPHLVAWRESENEPLNLCMIASAQPHSPREEIQT
jgi:hypothetical protein